METANPLIQKARIIVSRNSPIALLVGVAGFIGSHLSDQLLTKGIQVIGVDDFSLGEKRNLIVSSKDNHFHLINENVNNDEFLTNKTLNSLPRLDYAYFVVDALDLGTLYSKGLPNFVKLLANLKESGALKNTKIVFVSSIELYGGKLEYKGKLLKHAEGLFARLIKEKKLNGRVVRLASCYGPRMKFEASDPSVQLIKAAVAGRIHKENVDNDYISRSLYIADAANLLMKCVLSGGTSNKIYDGALINPVKVSAIKDALMEVEKGSKRYETQDLPSWPTPNLLKTVRELSWKPRTSLIEGLSETVNYFKEAGIKVEDAQISKFEDLGNKWSFKSIGEEGLGVRDQGIEESDEEEEEESPKKKRFLSREKGRFVMVTALIVFALVYPLINFLVGVFTIRYHLMQSSVYLEQGDFNKSFSEINLASVSLQNSSDTIKSLSILKKVGPLNSGLEKAEIMLSLAEEGVDGARYAVSGSEALFKTTKIISGEDKADPKPLYEKAQIDLTNATAKLSKVSSFFSNKEFQDGYPQILRSRIVDMSERMNYYRDIVDQAKSASFLMPQLTAIDSKKTYLLLLQNNLELRPTGGFIGSYAKITFENGKLTQINVDDIYNLDGGLKDVIEPPAEIKSDLGVNRWFLRDSNFDPDFPTSARQAEFFYRKEAGETVQGVIALDLSASSKLLSAVRGLNLSEYGDSVDSSNLFEKVVSHAEVSFFPGSQAKKNYLVSLQSQLFNKVFYLSNQNWPGIIQAISDSLKEKHMLVYLDDPTLFSYVTSTNWAGVFPRGSQENPGETSDFLAVVESNMGANKANYYLQRKSKLETTFGKEGQIQHKLTISYKNNSPSDVFPAGKYKNRFRIYLPLGSKLTKALLGETDVTQKFNSFTDYGRAGYSSLIEILPQEQKNLVLFYEEKEPVNFLEDKSAYRLEVFKQPGTDKDQFDFEFNYPINFQVDSNLRGIESSAQQIKVAEDLQNDLVFILNIKKKQ